MLISWSILLLFLLMVIGIISLAFLSSISMMRIVCGVALLLASSFCLLSAYRDSGRFSRTHFQEARATHFRELEVNDHEDWLAWAEQSSVDDDDDDDDDDDKQPQAQKSRQPKNSKGTAKIPPAGLTDSTTDHVSVQVEERPKWVDESVLIEKQDLEKLLKNPAGIPLEFVVASGRFATAEQARNDAAMMVHQLLLSKFGNHSSLSNPVKIYQAFTKKTYEEPYTSKLSDGTEMAMCRYYLQIEIENDELQAASHIMRKEDSRMRFRSAMGALLGATFALAACSVLLRPGIVRK